eukprot:gene1555-1973_t
MTKNLFLFFIYTTSLYFGFVNSLVSYSIYQTSNAYQIVAVNDTKSIAQAAYANDMYTTGWGYIAITTNSTYPDLVQASAAGYLEGFITQAMIYQNWNNMFVNEYKNTTATPAVQNWINDNIQYIEQQIQNNPNDPYWIHVNLVWTQLLSMIDGYNDATTDSSQELELIDFLLMNMDGDMGDLGPALNLSMEVYAKGINFDEESTPVKSLLEVMKKNSHCSGLVKLTDDLSELYSGHTTWSSFYEMVRMFKSYNLKYSTEAASRITMFSGYPGTLSSIDDFYLLDSRLVVTETTNGMMNNDYYHLIVPQSVLSWIRVIVANRMATDGLSWCNIFSLQNSGTYNNQWIITDYNKFVPGVEVKDGTLYVLEQIPGYIEFEDVTPILRAGYWPSYNVPYFEKIYNMSGFNNTAQYGNWFNYDSTPRAQIFRRDANQVYTMSDFQSIMRYNDWQNDPLSLGNAGNQISSRFDLVTKNDPNNQFLNKDAFGGIDSKVASYSLVHKLLVLAQSGPSHDYEPPFNWNDNAWKYTHIGMPDKWNFGWMIFKDNNVAN